MTEGAVTASAFMVGRKYSDGGGGGPRGATEFARLPEPAENGTLGQTGRQLIDPTNNDDDGENRA